ncbi:MAG: hypothetical protein ACJ763_18495 [Bdellovibrionia bacterium]
MRSTFLIFLCICVVSFLSSQALASKPEAPEWKGEGCDIVKEDLHLSPQKLFEEFIQRDSEGEFLQTSPWLNKAVMCPGYMGGPDSFYIISSKATQALGGNKFRVSYSVEGSVTSEQIGDQIYSVFKPKKEKVDEDYRIVKTPWGWKLASPWSTARVSVEKALSWVTKGEPRFDQKSRDLISNIKPHFTK